MTGGLDTRTRLRRALALAGHDPGEDATLRELVVRATRVIERHAQDLQAQRVRAATRALPSGDHGDPWRVGATVLVYTPDRNDWRRHLIVDRTLNDAGAVIDVRFPSGAATRFRLRQTARYATSGANGVISCYAVPDGTPPLEALAWFGPPMFRGAYRAYRFMVFLAGGQQCAAAVRARSLPEAAYLSTRAGYAVTVHHLRSCASETGGLAEEAANAHPDTLMVERSRDQWVPYAQAAQEKTP